MTLPGGTVTIPWCARCERSRFGRECPECGQALELEVFVQLARAQRSEQLAWDLAKALSPVVEQQLLIGAEHAAALAALGRFEEAASEALG